MFRCADINKRIERSRRMRAEATRRKKVRIQELIKVYEKHRDANPEYASIYLELAKAETQA